jgi:hypothetical protein
LERRRGRLDLRPPDGRPSFAQPSASHVEATSLLALRDEQALLDEGPQVAARDLLGHVRGRSVGRIAHAIADRSVGEREQKPFVQAAALRLAFEQIPLALELVRAAEQGFRPGGSAPSG